MLPLGSMKVTAAGSAAIGAELYGNLTLDSTGCGLVDDDTLGADLTADLRQELARAFRVSVNSTLITSFGCVDSSIIVNYVVWIPGQDDASEAAVEDAAITANSLNSLVGSDFTANWGAILMSDVTYVVTAVKQSQQGPKEEQLLPSEESSSGSADEAGSSPLPAAAVADTANSTTLITATAAGGGRKSNSSPNIAVITWATAAAGVAVLVAVVAIVSLRLMAKARCRRRTVPITGLLPPPAGSRRIYAWA
ncbi:hypothetical protein VOLCADRAFT_95823 [Volvox carteri f. nagariensis]|uniref:Uncharacterized protein n=1 Tax=Volvox carteri f. nagariensis TaxID=3068 RepID=D8U8G9_VOLCA|nr:uncharacterized protein VOLCADRAFT_95823 [Volvox carteri f. nagariensis]EFJ43977.1 hypothetical protein VOLCADRAFT_95823 [Volvox carteri f. nagariensis]|eukprot:XP_002954989.1 hypothetical protein VOLCADRAFT_95823 [Volvox carteri f. nagariensis]